MVVDEVDLCSFCAELVRLSATATLSDPPSTPHHPTYATLLASSKTCLLCHKIALLWSQRGFLETNECFDDSPIEMEMKGPQKTLSTVSWKLWKVGLHSLDTPMLYMASFTLAVCSLEDPASKLPAWESSATTREEKLSVIKDWLRECRRDPQHRDCQPEPFVPCRLVSVGLDGQPPRLVHMNRTHEGEHVEYATLSHCWGGSSPLRTTKSTLAKFSEEILAESIPPTFAEAMQIARSLGIPYIWIDSLCIVQDDLGDWEKEASQMDKIYAGSELTIAAAQSSDSSKGCFNAPDEDPKNQDVVFRAQIGGLRDSTVLARFYESDVRNRVTSRNILSSRAWVLQEQLLSPRFVSCMQPEVHWQCQAAHKTESGLSFGLLDEADGTVMGRFPRRVPQTSLWLHRAWEQVVENYTGRHLTYELDRVPAIAGILRHFASALDDVPILGLWNSTLARDMAWLRMSDRRAQPVDPRLPSWTWLSCPGEASLTFFDPQNHRAGSTWEGMSTEGHVQLLSWDVQWFGIPYTSPVKLAHIRVEGPVLEIEIGPSGEEVIRNPPYFQVFGENLKYVDKNKIPFRCAGRFDREEMSVAATYLCLLLLSNSRESKAFEVHEIFLILEPVDPQEEGRYKRVGLAKIWGPTPAFDLTKTMSLVLE